MIPPLIRALLLTLVLVLMVGSTLAQDSGGTRAGCDSCRFQIASLEQPVSLRGMWLFTRDDHPENKAVEHDTRDWKLLKTPGPWPAAYGDGKNYRVGWYRATLEFAPTLRQQEVVLLLNTNIAPTTVYLDGQEVFRRPSDANLQRQFTVQPIPLRFTVTQPRHVVAVRVDSAIMHGIYAQPLELRRYVANDPDIIWRRLLGGELRLVAAAIGFAFALFLLLIYAKTGYGMYLHAALSSLFCSTYLGSTTEIFLQMVSAESAFIVKTLGLDFAFFFARFVQYFHVTMPRFNRVFGAIMLLTSTVLASMLVWPSVDLIPPVVLLHYLACLLAGGPIFYATVQGLCQGRAGAGILLGAFGLLFVLSLHDVLLAAGLIDSIVLLPLAVSAALAAMLYVTSTDFANTFHQNQTLLNTLQTSNTALRRSLDMMAKMQHNAGMGIWMWHIQTDEILFSQNSMDLLQRDFDCRGPLPPGFAGRMGGTQSMDFVHPDDWPLYLGTVSQAIQSRQPQTMRCRIVRGDGSVRLMHLELDTEVDAEGEMQFVYGFVRDITEEQRVQAELEQHRHHLEALVGQRTEELRAAIHVAETAQHSAEAASRMKSEFLAMISHEIRTPLGGVIGMLKLTLKDAQLASEARTKLAVAQDNAENLLQIINDILDYSKLEAGKMTLECIDFDLPAVVNDAHGILQERARDKGLEFILEIAPDLPRWWQGDPVRLRQVLINLIGNAIKFTERGAIWIALHRGADGWLEFAVKDTGVGIPADVLPRLFQKFEQADISTTRKFGGTGLGLAICKNIIEVMGGSVKVESTPEVGTTFHFRLPLAEGHEPETVAASTSQQHTHCLSILCAEDGQTNQIIVREFVQGMGHTIDIAEDGQAALQALAAKDYDLVLMDSRMPRIDGLHALQLIRQGAQNVRDATIPVVALTANVGAEERERFFAAGANGFLGKPIDEAALHAELARMIELLRARGKSLPLQTGSDAIPEYITVLDNMFGLGSDVEAAQAANTPTPGFSQRARTAMQAAFTSEAPRLLGLIEEGLAGDDAQAIALAAHSLKGSAGYFGATALQALCRQAEQAADAGDLAGVQALLADLHAAVAQAVAGLKE